MKLSLTSTTLYGRVTEHPFFEPLEPEKQTKFIEVDPTSFAEDSKECSVDSDNQVVKNFIKTFWNTPVFHIYQQILPHTDCELSMDRWTFMSINQLVEHAKKYHDRFYEIAIAYMEMGCIAVLLYCPKTNKFFFHVDGGQDYDDRIAHYQQYHSPKYEPSKFRETKDAYTTEQEVLFSYDKLERSLCAYVFD